MIQLETCVTIERSLPEVFAFMGDIRNSPRWQTGLARTSLEPGTVMQAGARVRRSRRVAGVPVESLAEITLFEQNRRLGVRSTSGPFEFDAVYNFEPVNGGTKITWMCRVTTRGAYRLVEVLIGQIMVMETDVSFVILKNLLEAAPSPKRLPESALVKPEAVVSKTA